MISPLPKITNPLQPLKNFGNTIQSAISGQLGQKTAAPGALPWTSSNVKSPFFNYLSIKPDNWDQLFPYRLLVIDVTNQNQVVGGSAGSKVTVGGENNSIVTFEQMGSRWMFTLPITPQQLNIADTFSIATTATLRGVLEEHNGVKFKTISASGTMGVWAYRGSVTSPPTTPTPIQSVFGGTIEAFGGLKDQVGRIINIATSGHPASKPTVKNPVDAEKFSTGYYMSLALQQFLEQYAEAKKNPTNAGWRLIFDIPKQNQSFVVTPVQFNWRQSADKPLEIQYTMGFKAWRRIVLGTAPAGIKPSIQPLSPGILQRMLAVIEESRRAVSSSINLIGAVRSDVNKPLDFLRQTSLLLKDSVGAVVTAIDLPAQLILDFKDAISASAANLDISSLSTPATRKLLSAVKAENNVNPNSSQSKKAAPGSDSSAAKKIAEGPASSFDILNLVSLDSMVLSPQQRRAATAVINSAREITIDDLKTYRDTILELATQLSDYFGAGDQYYSTTYGKPAPKVRIQPMTLDEYDLLKTLYESVQSYDILTASTDLDDQKKQTNMEYVAGLADTSGIAFNVPNSKIMAPVPFGLTMEGIAMRYLGDPQRWVEIATLNNLREPYIDETGFQYSLLSNGFDRRITLSSMENLYVGQRVVLKSSTQPSSARRILSIDRLSDTSYLLALDGEPNLNQFLTTDLAYLQAYLPGTVNSQQKIYIPSDLPVPNDPNIVPPASVSSDPMVGMSKVDLLLTDSGDLAVNSFGDFRFSAGMTNIIQSLRIKFGTMRNSYLMHPEFGLGVRVGAMTSEVDVHDIYDSISKMIQDDPRFQSLEKLQIEIDGPKLTINLSVSLAGQNGVFPLSFQLAS